MSAMLAAKQLKRHRNKLEYVSCLQTIWRPQISDIVLHGCLNRMSHNNRFNSYVEKISGFCCERMFQFLCFCLLYGRCWSHRMMMELKRGVICLFINKFVPSCFWREKFSFSFWSIHWYRWIDEWNIECRLAIVKNKTTKPENNS